MNHRRAFLTAGGALAALSAMPQEAEADSDSRGYSIYVTGMVWNRQLAAPMNDWLIRVYAKADVLNNGSTSTPLGFATIGDDFHDPVGSHIELHSAVIQGDQVSITGAVTESKTASLVGQPVHITGKLKDTSVEGLTVSIGSATFSGAGLLVRIAIIAILIAL